MEEWVNGFEISLCWGGLTPMITDFDSLDVSRVISCHPDP